MGATTTDQATLVTALVSGDRTAFEGLYKQLNPSMVRLAATIVQSRAVAEEVTQDAWLAVLSSIEGFEGRSSLKSWMFAIVINKARTRAKRDGRSVSFDAGGSDDNLAAAFDGRGRWKQMPSLWDEMSPERIVAGKSVLAHVNAVIDALPAAQRAVVILRAQQGLDACEVSAALGISESNMRVLLHRARLAIRERLDELQ